MLSVFVLGANPRHLHEWHVWEQVKAARLQVADPISGNDFATLNNIVGTQIESPAFLVTYANLVGRERLIAVGRLRFSVSADVSAPGSTP